jgi:hypothetical protein
MKSMKEERVRIIQTVISVSERGLLPVSSIQ